VPFLLLTQTAMPLPLAAIGAIPGALGFITNLIGGKRRRNQEEKATKGFSQLTDLLRGNLNQDYFDSTEGMGAMQEIDDNASSFMDNINATANMSGMTDEARIALMGKSIGAKQDAYAGLARNSDLWRQRALQNYQGSLQQLFSAGMVNRGLQNQSMNNIVGGAQGAIDGATAVGALDGLFGKAKTGKGMGTGVGLGSAGGMGGMFGKTASALSMLKG
jgi:hypothetical protein